MMHAYFENMTSGLAAKLAENPNGPQAKKRFALEVARLGAKLYSGTERVAWCGVTVPFDLLHAMGVTSCFIEFVGAMLAASGMIAPFLEEAAHAGSALDTCAYHRAVFGAVKKGMMPKPDFLIASSAPCSGGLAALEILAREFKRDLFVLHVPQTDSKSSVRYLADQLQGMVDFVSAHTGVPLDQNRLREAIHLTNQARRLMVEVYRLAGQVPSPAGNRDLANFGITMSLLLGTEAAVSVAQTYVDEFTGRVERKEAGVPGERLRILWLQNRIQFKNPFVDWLQNEYCASIVGDELNQITWDPIDPDEPFLGMARRAISIPFNGPIEYRLAQIEKMVKADKIDGVINPCHWGCRQGTGARGLIEKRLKELKVPVLNLEVDCVDSNNFAEGQLKTRVEAFMEMLGG